MDLLQQTVTDVLVERIRNEIIQGKLRPGERLRLRDLADRYKISTMPVREAIQILATEGLVTGEARRGAVVTQLSIADVEDIYAVRATLEALATKLAAPHVTTDLLDTLNAITVEMDKYDEVGDMVRIVEANYRFHGLLYAASQRKHLCELIGALRHRTAHYLHMRAEQGGATLARQEHYAIVAALHNGNAEKAAAIMYEHITSASSSIIAFLQKNDASSQ